MSPEQFFVAAHPNTRISVYDYKGSGPPLLISHALGFHARCYNKMIEGLCHHFHCYGIDHRGSGDSTMTIDDADVQDGRYRGKDNSLLALDTVPTLQGYAEDIVALIDHLHISDVFLFGHSAGGIASLAACVKLRGRVRGVYIYESPLIKPDDGSPLELRRLFGRNALAEGLRRRALRRRHQFASKEEALKIFGSKGFKTFHPQVLMDFVRYGLTTSKDANSVELKMQKVVEAMMYVELENQTGQVYSETLKIDAPIWLGYGEHGDVVASQLELWPIAKPIRLKNAGHFFPFTDPEEMASAILTAFASFAKL